MKGERDLISNRHFKKFSRIFGFAIFILLFTVIGGNLFFAKNSNKLAHADSVATGVGSVHLLPTDDGIVFNGTEWINTGISGFSDMNIKVDFQPELSSENPNSALWGALNSGSEPYDGGVFFISGAYRGDYSYFEFVSCSTTLCSSKSPYFSGDRQTMSYDSIAGTFDINGITQFTATETPPEMSSNIFLGNIGTQSGSPYTDLANSYIGTVYSFIISQNNKPLASYQPAVQCASNNTLIYGFLDSVSGNFITSTAGGPFTATTPVEYSDYCVDTTSPVEPPVIPPIESEKPETPSIPVVSVPNTGFRR